MNAEFVVLAEAHKGMLSFDKRTFQRLAAGLRDGHYEIFVQRLRANRSVQANRFYWGVVIAALADYTGHTPDELHEILKQKFLPRRLALTNDTGDIVDEFTMGGSTRKLTVAQFAEYVERVRVFAAEELGVTTPDPPP